MCLREQPTDQLPTGCDLARLLAEQECHSTDRFAAGPQRWSARLLRHYGTLQAAETPSSSNRPIMCSGICWELAPSSSWSLAKSSPTSSPASAAFMRAATGIG